MEHFGNLPSSDITHSSVTESADRLFLWESIPKLAEAQTFSVYEGSPAFLEISRWTVNKVDPDTGAHVHALGDQVAITNKLYDGSLKLEAGNHGWNLPPYETLPGMGTPEMKRQQVFTPDRYETLMTWYFGDFRHISGQGPFVNHQDTLMSVTGGVGFLREARRVVRLHNISPFKFFYTFTLTGMVVATKTHLVSERDLVAQSVNMRPCVGIHLVHRLSAKFQKRRAIPIGFVQLVHAECLRLSCTHIQIK